MYPYQEEYIANLKEISLLTMYQKPEGNTFEEYLKELQRCQKYVAQKIARNMVLLREELFPLLDHLYGAGQEELQSLQEFAGQLLSVSNELDAGLFRQIHKALLSLARVKKDQGSMIRELYWLGIGYNNLNNKLVGLPQEESERYSLQMRLYFTEAAAYLKYYDELDDTETRSFILRSRSNMSLGAFKSPSDKIRTVKRSLQILQDKDYQQKAPELPWERFIFMTHRHMAASISHSRENAMTSEDIADLMESVYIVYQKQNKEAASQNKKQPAHSQFSYFAIEYYCGLETLDHLLTKMEHLMDTADLSDFSMEGMYGIISLPAFYCQYLNDYPERIPERTEYIESLYQRVLTYVGSFPDAASNENLFFYLRQLSSTFLETRNSISYKEFLLKLQILFAPDIYVHSWVVGKTAALFCKLIIEEEPCFFDDIDSIRQICDPEEKQRELLNYALECGLLHDVGKISFMNLYTRTARQWFEEEYELAHLHTSLGKTWLSGRDSTRRFAPIAHGHHSWYDGSHGYPDSYKRLKCQCRQMVDVIALIDWLDHVTDIAILHTGAMKTFDEAIKSAVSLEGKRFSPLLTARLLDTNVINKLRQSFESSRQDAYLQIYKSQENGEP